MTDLTHSFERSVVICARRDTVFRYFTDSERFAAWWGAGSSIDPRPGGAVRIVYPNGVVVSGEVVELTSGERITFTYGYEDADKPIPPPDLAAVEGAVAPDDPGSKLRQGAMVPR